MRRNPKTPKTPKNRNQGLLINDWCGLFMSEEGQVFRCSVLVFSVAEVDVSVIPYEGSDNVLS